MKSNLSLNSQEVTDIHRQIEELIQRFANGHGKSVSDPMANEKALFDIFEYCGLETRSSIRLRFGEKQFEVDGDFTVNIAGESKKIAIEIRHSTRPDSIIRAIEQTRKIKYAGAYDRALVIVRGDIPETVRRRAESDGVGYVDVLGISELRSWLWKNAPFLQPSETSKETTCAQIIREAMRSIAERLAQKPDEISTIDWRDMERVLREVFEGMGFDTILTRCGKDGGFDLELTTEVNQVKETYLVEVKHWTNQRPGKTNLQKLVRVTARQKANLGIMLSSSGFLPSIYEGITEAERTTVALGGRDKIIGLCKIYYRIGQQIWSPDTSISNYLREGLL